MSTRVTDKTLLSDSLRRNEMKLQVIYPLGVSVSVALCGAGRRPLAIELSRIVEV